MLRGVAGWLGPRVGLGGFRKAVKMAMVFGERKIRKLDLLGKLPTNHCTDIPLSFSQK